MSPQISSLFRFSLSGTRTAAEILCCQVHCPYTQQRAASILSTLSDNPSAFSRAIRVGRGPSSGKGKTSGRGHKGQKQRGKVPRGFNGGQTPDEVVHGIRGDHNYDHFAADIKPLNLYKIQDWVEQGRLDPSKPITIKELCESRCVSNVKDGVKLLAKGSEHLKVPMNVIISRASAKAISTIEAAGGSVTTRHYTPFALKRILQGKMDPINSLQAQIPAGEYTAKRAFDNRLPDPTSRKDIEYYRDPAHRGYLSHLVPEGHGPSLFFKTPGTGRVAGSKTANAKNLAAGDRLW